MMKNKRRIIATVVAVLISFAAALPAAAQEADPAPAEGMEADVWTDQEAADAFTDDSVSPFVLEKLSQDDFEKAAAQGTESAASDEASGSDQTSEEYIYENDVLEIGGGFWRISTPEMTSSRIVISGDAGLIFSDLDVLAQDGAALTVAPGAEVRIVLEQGSISYLMGAVGYPAVSLSDTDGAQDNEESGEQGAALTVYGCGYLTLEGGSGCAAAEGRLTDRTVPDPLEEDAEFADVERITFIDNIEEPAAAAEDEGTAQETASEETASDPMEVEGDQAQEQQTADAAAEEMSADAAAQQQTAGAAEEEETADTAEEKQTADAAAEEKTADTAEEKQTAGTTAEEKTTDTAAEKQTADAAAEEKTTDTAEEKQTADAAAEEKTTDIAEGKQEADPEKGELTAEIPEKAQKTAAEVTVSAAKADAAASGEKDNTSTEAESGSSGEAEEKSAEEAEDISFSVEVEWDDEEDHDAIRPSLLTVSLYANGEETGRTVVLHDDNDWTAEFSSLPAEVKGEPVAYSIVSEPVSGYTASIRGDSSDGYTVTNVHVINPTGRSSEEEVNRIRKKAGENRAAAGVTTVTTTKVARTTANYTTAIPGTSTAMAKRRSPKTADAAEPALWAVPLLIGIAGVYVWMRREQK